MESLVARNNSIDSCRRELSESFCLASPYRCSSKMCWALTCVEGPPGCRHRGGQVVVLQWHLDVNSPVVKASSGLIGQESKRF